MGLPTELSTLFAEMLGKVAEDIKDCVSLLQWALFSMRPLSSNESYLAIHYSYVSPSNQHVSCPDHDRLEKDLLNCSCGSVGMTITEPPAIQFIHETVHGFVINADGLVQIQPQLAVAIEGSFHEKSTGTCLHSIQCSEGPTCHSQQMVRKVDKQPASGRKKRFPSLEQVCCEQYFSSCQRSTEIWTFPGRVCQSYQG